MAVIFVGSAIQDQLGGTWLLTIGIVLLAMLLLIAVVRLHSRVYPAFPLHTISTDRPLAVATPEETLLMIGIRFTNRQASRRVNLSIELMWSLRFLNGAQLGPYRCWKRTEDRGSLDIIKDPWIIGPDTTEVRFGVFSTQIIPGLRLEDNEPVFREGTTLFLRIIDLVSSGQIDVPVNELSTIAAGRRT